MRCLVLEIATAFGLAMTRRTEGRSACGFPTYETPLLFSPNLLFYRQKG